VRLQLVARHPVLDHGLRALTKRRTACLRAVAKQLEGLFPANNPVFTGGIGLAVIGAAAAVARKGQHAVPVGDRGLRPEAAAQGAVSLWPWRVVTC
jgi:hypothetical protein